MSVKYFLDTNILIYVFDPTAPLKRERATALVNRALTLGEGCISLQVAQDRGAAHRQTHSLPERVLATPAASHLAITLHPNRGPGG